MAPFLHHKSLISLFLSLLVAFHSLGFASAATCGEGYQRQLEVASTCEADSETCPEDCEPALRAYIDDCSPTFAELGFVVIATNLDACFDTVFDIYKENRGTDCEGNLEAYRSAWPFLCVGACTNECVHVVEGVCNHCSGALDSDTANSVEFELSISASLCPQAQCDLGSTGSSSSGSSSSSSGGGSSSSSTGNSGGQALNHTSALNVVVPLVVVWWTLSFSIGFLEY